MMAVSRTDTSTLGRWWWTVDRWTLAALLMLIGFGYVMMLAASPAVAERVIGTAARSLLFLKQVVFLGLAAALMVAVSLLSPRAVRRLALLGCLGALALTAATLVIGFETKGARRWLAFPLLGTMQPSEFLKPCLAVVTAWLLAEGKAAAALRAASARPGLGLLHGQLLWPALAMLLLGFVAVVLKSQPDIGMLMVVMSVFLAQFFVAGLNLLLVGVIGAMVVAGGIGAYFILPHVQSRVDRFLDPASGDTFQITKALEAFGNGGLFGRGPGEGRVKNALPDAHADFVFAVAGEEFGFIICLLILLLFAFVVVRGLVRLLGETDMFVVLAATGLLAQFGLQAFVNMASSLHLIPTKGMTLPLVSYGGSSVLAIALGMGMLLALTRRRGSRAEGGA
ncbi:FtsW/RodA/SpoVE family cell cycle protein [Siccirubricoccus sp. G192]|uniref:FtsW/RodA/SpoVE family cell cycle protein n=1 Tax=Siccirubricoccus sp. G192 TaxID=2849651 RepID=UPI001C2CA92E|nr:putative peptidoglycan glycosyltransferase FtsW [Siccirubricoccus sp. G192]MBV1797118.1 putative lipid II flippase FtsW [Siccirubricoccus sp. G192]